MTTSPKLQVLKTLVLAAGHTRALKDGTVKPRGIELDHVDTARGKPPFQWMVPKAELDVAEMPLASYLSTRVTHQPFTAIPVFVRRSFHHHRVHYNARSGVRRPEDLQGKRVGIRRTYTGSWGFWIRGILASEYGLDPSSVTWVVEDDDRWPGYRPPPNVVVAQGESLAQMLASGELAAAIDIEGVGSPDVRPLFPDAGEAEAQWYKKTGVYPIDHLIVINDAALASDPRIAGELYAAFKAAKEAYLQQLSTSSPRSPEDEAMVRMKSVVGDDPVPYGLSQNRRTLEAAAQFAVEQQITPRKYRLEELFVSSTLEFS